MNDLEKLITDLSNYWDISPEKVVDRLNHMNESEINKLIKSMKRKFQGGGYLSNGMPIGNIIMMSKITESVPKKNHDELLKMAAQKAAEQQSQQLQRDASELQSQMFKTQMELMEKRRNSELNDKLRAPFKPTEAGSVGPKYYNGPRPKFEDGGIIKCLKGGKTYAECKKCGGKTLKAEGGDKVRRTDIPGYAWTYPDGTDVLTQDAVGPQPLPGSYYGIPGSTPEYETWRTIKTDKGGNPKRYDFKVFVNNGDALGPVGKYTTDNNFFRKLRGWKTMSEDMFKEWNGRYSANKLAKGGLLKKK